MVVLIMAVKVLIPRNLMKIGDIFSRTGFISILWQQFQYDTGITLLDKHSNQYHHTVLLNSRNLYRINKEMIRAI